MGSAVNDGSPLLRPSSGEQLAGSSIHSLLTQHKHELRLDDDQVAAYASQLERQCIRTVADLAGLADSCFPRLDVPLLLQSWLYLHRNPGGDLQQQRSGSPMASPRAALRPPPPVEVTVKVYSISALDIREGQFFCRFNVMLDWIDEELIGVDPGSIDWDECFAPLVEIENAKEELTVVGGAARPRVHDSERGWIKLTQVYKGLLQCEDMDFHDFPFDVQALPIVLKSRTMARRGRGSERRRFVELVHPQALRPTMQDKHGFCEYGEGHAFAGDSLVEWVVQSIEGQASSQAIVNVPVGTPASAVIDALAPGTLRVEWCTDLLAAAGVRPGMQLVRVDNRAVGAVVHATRLLSDQSAPRVVLFETVRRADTYTVRVYIQRRWMNIAWNVVFPVFILISLALVAFGIEVEDIGDRESVTLTLLLTCCTLKYLTREVLPPVPYVTTLDSYILYAMFCTWLNAIEHVFVYTVQTRGGGAQLAARFDALWLSCLNVGFVCIHAWLLRRWKAMHKGGVGRTLVGGHLAHRLGRPGAAARAGAAARSPSVGPLRAHSGPRL